MSEERSTNEENQSNKGRNLLIALGLNVTLTVAEIVGSLVSGSLSLLGDAAHNGSDAASILISYIAWRISQREADRRYTFGYDRAETVGALINLTTLFVIGLFLVYKAIDRLISPTGINGTVMLILGVVALVEDALSAYVLSGSRGLNVKSAWLHMIADTMGSVAVIAGAVMIMVWDIRWVDPALTALIAAYLFVHASIEIRKAVAVLMDTAPADFDFGSLVREIMRVPGVADVHHVHLWRRAERRLALEAHIAVRESDLRKIAELKRGLKDTLRERFDVEHATLEFEPEDDVRHSREVLRKQE